MLGWFSCMVGFHLMRTQDERTTKFYKGQMRYDVASRLDICERPNCKELRHYSQVVYIDDYRYEPRVYVI